MPRSSNQSAILIRRFSGVCLVALAFACIVSNTAGAQTFSIDLNDVSRIYDDLYPERTRTAVWDTIPSFDYDRVDLGNQRYEAPHFLRSDFGRTETRVEFLDYDGMRARFRFPSVYDFLLRQDEAGEFFMYRTRDMSIPDLEVELVPLDRVAETVRRESLRQLWRDTSIEGIKAQRLDTSNVGSGGVRIDIPLPMPTQLESIFGPSEKTHINITGREEITFAGETRRVDPFLGVEGRTEQSLFPSLDMRQTLDVRLTGTIGDKVNIQVDHSSDAISDDANRIRLNYTGYDDDVIKLIELGNTSLSLPGSQLVSFSTQSQGLFGVKVLAQLGPTDITFIASKQEGESSTSSFSPSGGSIGQTERVTRRDIDFVKDKYFFFNHPLINTLENIPNQSFNIDVYREVRPQDLQINPELIRINGRAFVDRFGTGSDIDAAIANIAASQAPGVPSEAGQFELLTLGNDYQFVLDAETLEPIGLELTRAVSDNEQRAIAVAYTNRVGQVIGGQRYSSFRDDISPGAPQDSVVLELLKNRSPRPTGEFAYLWDYMMRNIYNLGLSNIDPESFSLQIEDNLVPRLDKTTPNDVDVPYIRIFGLDRFDESGQPGPDNRIDLRSGLIDLRSGTLTFPVLQPFAPPEDSVRTWTDGQFWFKDPNLVDADSVAFGQRFVAQYDTSAALYTTYVGDRILDYHQYTMVIEAVSTTKTFRINAVNIIENSEVVTLDGRRLARGQDYEINYETGEVELKGPALADLTPASKINIDYEYKPFGGGASSSLVGFSTLTRFGEDARVGSTWLYESKSVAAENPRIGEEPTRAIVGGVNGSIQHQSEFLTQLVNRLPLVDTDAPSNLQLSGEIAMSIPDPNTKGEAFIDDFEGVEDSDRLSLSRRSWYAASLPIVPGENFAFEDTSRVRLIWYNIEPELGLRKRDLNPELDERENTLTTSLDIEIDPGQVTDDTLKYAGVMTGFGGGGLDLTQGQFIEVWVNDFKWDDETNSPLTRGGRIRIDLGNIDENFFRPDTNTFEDEDRSRDGFAAAIDDSGLDGLFNDSDNNPDGESEPFDPRRGSPEDPAGDDISLQRINGRFTKANGTEANNQYDTEDLDRSGQLDRVNSYYSFEVDLADSAVVDIRRQYPGYDGFDNEAHKNDTWRLYRIRLGDATIVSPSGQRPSLDQIKHARIWFNDVGEIVRNDGAVGSRRVQLADLKIVGNRWQEDGVRDLADKKKDMTSTEFAIGVISTKSDPGVYQPPIAPNVQNEVAEKETSLFLRYDTLEDSTQVRIFKRFAGDGIDLTLYRELNFWVHSDKLDGDLEYYFRMGTNESNYYEVAVPLTPAYFNATGWARVLTPLSDITDLKFAAADSAVYGTARDVIENRTYPTTMVGLPNLFTVRFLYAGIRNKGGNGTVHSGELWLNDIWVGDVKRDIDYAQRVSGSVTLGGGVLNLTGGWTRTGADFRSLRQRRGSGANDQTVAVSGKTNLQHFIPLGGFSIPISGNFNRATSKPKFRPNSDTELDDPALRDSLETVRTTRGFSTSLSKKGSSNVLLKYTIDKMTTNFSYSKSQLKSPSSRDTTTSMTGTLGYQINWAQNKTIPLGIKGWRMRWWLNSLNARTSASRRTTRRSRLVGDEFTQDPYQWSASLKNSGSMNYSPFKSLTSSFSINIDRDLRLPQEWYGVEVGRETRRNHTFKVNYRPPPMWLIGLFSPDIDMTTGYSEDASPNVRRPGDPRGTRNVSSNRTASVKMRFDAGRYIEGLFGKVGWEFGEKDERGRRRGRGRGRGAGGPAGVGTAVGEPPGPADSTVAGEAPADTTSGRKGVSATIALRKIGEILINVRPINANISQRVGNNYLRIPDRPSLAYQFGFDNSTGIVEDGTSYNDPERLSESLALNLDSGVQITDDIDVAARYSRTITDTDFRENQARAISQTFPDLQVSWKGIERFGLFRSFVSASQANMNFKRFKQESGRRDEDPDNIRETLTLSPGLLMTWKNGVNSNIGVSFTRNTNTTRGSSSETSNISVNLDLKKTFRGGTGFKLPIPFFRKEVKWASQLDSNLSIAYSRATGKRFTEGSAFFEPIPATTSVRVSPNVAYSFSRALSGRAFVDYSRSYNEATDQTVTTVRVGVTAIFTF